MLTWLCIIAIKNHLLRRWQWCVNVYETGMPLLRMEKLQIEHNRFVCSSNSSNCVKTWPSIEVEREGKWFQTSQLEHERTTETCWLGSIWHNVNTAENNLLQRWQWCVNVYVKITIHTYIERLTKCITTTSGSVFTGVTDPHFTVLNYWCMTFCLCFTL